MNVATIGAPAPAPMPSLAAQGLAPVDTAPSAGFGSALTAVLQPGALQPASPQPAATLPGQPLLLEEAAAATVEMAAQPQASTTKQSAPAKPKFEAASPKTAHADLAKPADQPSTEVEQPLIGTQNSASETAVQDPTVLQKPADSISTAHPVKAKDEAEAPPPDVPAVAEDNVTAPLPVQLVAVPATQPQQKETGHAEAPAGRAQTADKSVTLTTGSGLAERAGAKEGPEATDPKEPAFAKKDAPAKDSQPKVDAQKPDSPAPRSDNAPAPLASSQAPTAAPARVAAPLPQPAPAHEPVVTARPGQIGHEMGVEIARHASAGKDELLVRLNPQSMGRIEVRMSFDDQGSLRAVVSADSTAALDMLRRDAGDLGRTLADAGVRADLDSFRFTSRNGGGDGNTQMSWQNGRQDGGGGHGGQQQRHRQNDGYAWGQATDPGEPDYRRLRTSGQVDLMA